MTRFILGLLGGVGLTLMYGAKKSQERKEAEAGEQKEKKTEDKVVADKETTNPTNPTT